MLARRGQIEPRVIYLAPGQPGWDQRADWFGRGGGYSSTVLRSRQRPRPGRTPVTLPSGLGAALSAADPACVVSSEYGPATLLSLLWCRRRRRPLVVLTELTPWSDAALSGVQRRLHPLVARAADGFVAVSSQGAARLERLGVPPDRVEVAIQSADLAAMAPARAAREGRPPPVRILCVARLVPDKNLELLVDAFAAAGFAPGEAELELRGSGPLEEDLRRRGRRPGPAVTVGGYASPPELPALYAAADVLALVSLHEPFGVTMREGAAAGLPLLCSRRAGAAGDVAVDGENALLVDPEDRGAVTAALRRLVREPGLRARLGRGSIAVTQRHPLEADAEAFERAVLRAVERRS
jgi:glycosyltransferase involved in cell wall biosynthesis